MIYDIGSVSQGTTRLEDLIPVFLGLLPAIPYKHPLREKIEDRLRFSEDENNSYDYYETAEAEQDFIELVDAVQKFAPPYCYFGEHPCDGADYGFWTISGIDETIKGDGGLVVDDLTEIDKNKNKRFLLKSPFTYVLLRNDQDSITLYLYDRKALRLHGVWED